MATKKAGSTAKKKTTTTKSKSAATAKPSTTTKVTTIKAVESEPTTKAAVANTTVRSSRFTNKTAIVSALIGEFIGTFLLTIALLGTKGDPLYMGFAIAGVVLIVGTISGAHVNPAVTVGAWVTRKVTSLRALGYIVAQILGGTLAYVALTTFISAAPTPEAQSAAMAAQQTPTVFHVAEVTVKNQWLVFFIELIAASIFTFAVAGAFKIVNDRLAKAFTVGLGLLVAGIFGTIAAGYISANTVFNPAMALAAQAVNFSSFNPVVFAAYIVAPLLGGVIGFGLRDVLTSAEKKI